MPAPSYAVRTIPADDPAALLRAVLATNETTSDPRLRELMGALIRHLHAFASETKLTPIELHAALNFLVGICQKSCCC